MQRKERLEKYRALCIEEQLSYNLQAWWWDACEGEDAWDVCLVFGKKSEIIGAFPFVKKSKMGLNHIRQCRFSTYQDIYIRYPQNPNTKTQTINSIEKRIYQQLIEKLPKFHFFDISFHPRMNNWLPFYWSNFKQTTRYTHVLKGSVSREEIFKEFKKSLRTDIRKAEKNEFELIKSDQIFEFASELKNSYNSKNIVFDDKSFIRLDEALNKRKLRTIWIAKQNGQFAAGLYIIHDNGNTNCIYSVQNSKIKNQTPLNQLMWEAIQMYIPISKTFDFEGSMIPDVEHALRAFGAQLTPYMRIYKAKNKFLHTMGLLFNKFP